MTKPKRPILVGDRIEFISVHGVSWYPNQKEDPRFNAIATKHFGTVRAIKEDTLLVDWEDGSTTGVHRRMVTKVIRKKKKREPRVVFETVWSGNNSRCLHFSEVSAKNFMERERPGVQYKLVKFREII